MLHLYQIAILFRLGASCRPSLPVGSSTVRESALLHGGLHTRERVGAAKEKKKGRGLHSKSVAYSPEQTRVVESSTETSRG